MLALKNMRPFHFILLTCLVLSACQPVQKESALSLLPLLEGSEAISGKQAYRDSPFLTAGDQLYLVGHQNGQFPDLGWHITGEMGGIWHHPIKLMDGIAIQITDAAGTTQCLNEAVKFQNYPIAAQLSYDLAAMGLKVEQLHFVPDELGGMITELVISNNNQDNFQGTLQFQGMIDLRPTWLGERTQMVDQADEATFNETFGAWEAKDQGNEWYVLFGSSEMALPIEKEICQQNRAGQGIDRGLEIDIDIPANEERSFQFFIAGSHQSKAKARATYQNLKEEPLQLFKEKQQRYQAMAQQVQLDIPDEQMAQAFLWTRYASDWLRFEVNEIGAGIAAGIPDYPWWFGCDQTYSVRGLIHAGQAQIAKEALESLISLSEKENSTGQIVHEVSTNGAVFNPGNINETPHFISTVWEYFRWTNDLALLEKAYPIAQKGLSWLEAQDKDNNGYPDGHGMMEIHGMDAEMMDVIAYTQEAYAAAAKMATFFEDEELAQDYQQKATVLAQKINNEWWVDTEASYADFRSDRKKALELIDGALVRADTLNKPWSVEELAAAKKRILASSDQDLAPYAFYHNWVVNTPLELGIADPAKAMKALETAKKYVNPFGVYVTGIDRKQEDTNPEAFAALKAKESFNYTGAVMTLPTGVQAIASCQYGQMDDALDYLQRMLTSFSYAVPGSMYEVSPDYGMLAQAWNIYAVAKPIVGFFFGVQPAAYREYIRIEPQLPSKWELASITQLPIGENTVSIKIDDNHYQIEQSLDWEIDLVLPINTTNIMLNGEEIQLEEETTVKLRGLKNELFIVK